MSLTWQHSPSSGPKNRRVWQAFALSLLVLSLALAMLILGQWVENTARQPIEIREVSLALPPPPPPPTQQQTEAVETSVQLSVQGQGVAMQLTPIKLPQALEMVEPPVPEVRPENQQWNLDLAVDWSAFGLDELDALPQLLTTVKAKFPKSLVRRGIVQVVVKLDIFIDEKGRLNLISVIENPYPELDSEITKIVKSARFSPPKKDGVAVRARFVWPVEIKKP